MVRDDGGSPVPARVRDWWVTLGIGISAVSAAVSSFAGLRGLAVAAGWPVWLAWLLPSTIDAYGMTATRVWLAGSTGSARARRFARTNAVGAIGLSVAGNASYHLIAVHLVAVTWTVVVAVGAVPALVLGLVAHLAVLRNQIDAVPVVAADSVRTPPGREVRTVVRQSGPGPARKAVPGTPKRSEEELVRAARDADTVHRQTHGRSISRDALRQELRISGARATALLRQIRSEPPGASNEA